MGTAKTLKKIMVDKGETAVALAERMGKTKQTVYNTFFNDKMRIETAIEYGKALGCSLCFIDDETGEIYKIV